MAFDLRFEASFWAPDVVQLMLGDEQLGEDVAIDSPHVTAQRVIPAVEPGVYDLPVAAGDSVLAAPSSR